MNKKLIVVAGPTAVGKTSVAISLAQHLGTEIISADSRQFYRELIIGTAKPTVQELEQVPHHFINSHSIETHVDAGKYSREARKLVAHLFNKYDQLVVVGGSGLFIKALIEGFDDIPPIPDTLRERLRQEYKEKGLDWLQEMVQQADPDYYKKADILNPHRLLRTLEILEAGKKPMSFWLQGKKQPLPYETVFIGLELPREELYQRINNRIDQMIAQGLYEEAESLVSKRAMQALQTVGYKEIFGYLDKAYDKAEATRLIKRNSRHYAKRQLTWFKRKDDMAWFHPSKLSDIIKFTQSHG